MEVVDRRDAQTLLPIVQRVCLPGTIIYSDQWAGYQQLQEVTGLQHRQVNHSVNFVNPANGVHTQAIEGYWSKHKNRLKQLKGLHRPHMVSHLAECMWRDRFRNNAFLTLLQHISQQFQL